MRKTANSNTAPASPWTAADIADEDRLTENLAAPVVRYSATRRRAMVRWLKASIFCMPIIALIALASLAPKGNDAPPPAQLTSTTANSSPGKAAATAAVNSWIAQNPSPVPGGQILSWDGYTNIPAPKLNAQQRKAGLAGTGTYEVDRFTIAATSQGATILYSTEVEVNTSGGVSTVTGQPTLMPRVAPGASGSSAQVWPGWSTVSPSTSVTAAVKAWAAAFTSGQSDTLRLATGDPNANDAYLTLSGASVKNTAISSAAAKPTDTGNPPKSPSKIIARVNMQLVWSGAAAATNSDGTTSAPTVTYDVLIEGASSGSPRVVAWGGPGTGPSLTPYMNALPNTVVDDSSSDPAPASTPAPTPGGN